jgi:hypothetical protein
MEPTAGKQFLIDKVIEQAKLENVPLSQVERKMLYYTEVYPSLPDIYEANEEFERNYNTDDYEAKVASLLRNGRSRDQSQNPEREQQWRDALDALSRQDHYILVMVNQAFGFRQSKGSRNRLRDFLIYIGIAVALVLIAFVASVWRGGR